MKILVEQELLNSKLGIISNLLGRQGIDYLAMDAYGDSVTIHAQGTDSDVSLSLESDNLNDGSICIQRNKLIDLVKLMNGEVSINALANGRAQVRDNKDTFRLSTIERSMFQDVEHPKLIKYEVRSSVLEQAIEAVSFAMAHREDERFTMHGAHLTISLDGDLEMTATDSQRIANVTFSLPEEPLDDLDILIPDRAMNGLLRLCSYAPEIKISHDDTKIYFTAGSIKYSVGKLVGSFPNTKLIAATVDENYKGVSLNKTAFMQAVKKVSALAEQPSVIITIIKNEMIVSVQGTSCEGAVRFPIKSDIEFKFLISYRYLLDFLETVKCDELKIKVKGPTDVIEFRPEEYKDHSVVYLLAPMRLPEETK